MTYEKVVDIILRVFAVIGIMSFFFIASAGVGYWWAKYGESYYLNATKSIVPCGSCQLYKFKDK